MRQQLSATRVLVRASRRQFPGRRYVNATAMVLLATLVRLPFEGFLQGRAPYGLYFPMLVYVAWTWGVGPTVLAAALSLIAAIFVFIPPAFSFTSMDTSSRRQV